MSNKIQELRTFFRVSNATFDFLNSIKLAFKGKVIPNKMHQLHKIALEEIEKENPDLIKMDNLLAEMESLADSNDKSKI
jgi:hypothetical protein